jgi:serralysin
MATAISATAFIGTLGVNTHLDFGGTYSDLAQVESDLKYLGVLNVRDSAEVASDAQTWLAVSQATGVKFDDYIAETSQAGMQADMRYMTQLADEGVLNAVEGGNEEDDSYPQSLDNTLAATAQVQRQLYALGQKLGLPVINMSFGAGWTAANDWEGDYGSVGNLAGYATYANAHTYPNPGQLPNSAIQQLNADAGLAATGRPVITTEIGWDTSSVSETTIAQYVVDATFDGIADGDAGMYFYALYDDSSGNWGLFNSNGTARPAATALHDLTTLLADTGAKAATFKPGSLCYSLSGTQSTDNSILIEKSNGSYWIGLWNEGGSTHKVVVTLPSAASEIEVFDPVAGTSSIESASNTSTISVSLGGDPLLIEVVGVASSTGTGSGSTGTGKGTTTATGPNFTLPGSETTTTGSTVAITGASVTDAFAANNPGTLVLNVNDTSGLISMTSGGTRIAGSGTHAMSVTGTLAQINADLATLSYTAGSNAGGDSIIVDVWDQAGVEGSKTIEVTVTAAAKTTTTTTITTTTTTPTGPAITVPANDSVTTGTAIMVGSVSVADAFAASNPGTMVLNVGATRGLIVMTSGGAELAGSGTHAMSVTGTLAQINADLATLTYTAGSSAGADTISVNVWDQAGLDATKSIGVTVSLKPAVAIAASNADPVELVSNTIITASAGSHMIFIGGSSDTIRAAGGTETVQAFQGGNKITTGAGNDTISFAGSLNTINAGAGTNTLNDSGSNNTIVMPRSGKGFDNVFGYVLQNGDTLDFRAALADTSWNGSQATLENFLHVAASGADAIISLSKTSKGAATHIANLEGAGQVMLSTLLAHSIT